MSSESEGETGSIPSAARYRSIGTKRNRSEEADNGGSPVVKRINVAGRTIIIIIIVILIIALKC